MPEKEPEGYECFKKSAKSLKGDWKTPNSKKPPPNEGCDMCTETPAL
jgi:hypothetical protein